MTAAPFGRSQRLYDAVYSWKDYAAEAERLQPHLRGTSILDVACGTGGHIPHLRGAYEVVGVDIDSGMLDIAREKNPGAEFHAGDMRYFELSRTFGTVMCLFSSIGYLPTVSDLDRALACFARHVEPGGAVLIEPWIKAGEFEPRLPQSVIGESDGLRVARMTLLELEGDSTVLTMHYLVGSEGRIDHLQEVHRLRLFSDEEYRGAFERAGLAVELDADGPMGRGLYIGARR